jgi:hypothetical protein
VIELLEVAIFLINQLQSDFIFQKYISVSVSTGRLAIIYQSKGHQTLLQSGLTTICQTFVGSDSVCFIFANNDESLGSIKTLLTVSTIISYSFK